MIIFCGNILPYPQKSMNIWLTPYLLYAVPKLYVLFEMGNFFYEDFIICSVYVFTRKESRLFWFIKKLGNISKYVFGYYTGVIVSVVVVGIIRGLKTRSFSDFVFIIISVIILNFLSSLIFVLLTNVLSLYSNSRLSILYSVLVWTVCFLQAFVYIGNIQPLLIKLNPVLQPVIIWHDNYFLKKYNVFEIEPIHTFDMLWSLLVLCIYLLGIILFGVRVIKTIEITDRD